MAPPRGRPLDPYAKLTKTNSRSLSCRVTHRMHRALEAQAAIERRSPGNLMRVLIEEGLIRRAEGKVA